MPARIDEIDKLRKKRSRKAFIKRLVVFILIVALIFALFIGMRYASDYDIGGFISDTINGLGSGPGFPLDFAGNTVNAMYPAKNAVALLTDTGLYIYKSDAKELSHTYFDYSSPVVVPAQNRFFIYDCFGYSYRIESKSDTVLDKTLEDKVVCADYSRSGHYAVVTESARCLALLTVYDKNGNAMLTSIADRLGPGFNYMKDASLVDLDRGFEAVAAARQFSADNSALVTRDLGARAVAAVLAIAAAILGLSLIHI